MDLSSQCEGRYVKYVSTISVKVKKHPLRAQAGNIPGIFRRSHEITKLNRSPSQTLQWNVDVALARMRRVVDDNHSHPILRCFPAICDEILPGRVVVPRRADFEHLPGALLKRSFRERSQQAVVECSGPDRPPLRLSASQLHRYSGSSSFKFPFME